MTQTAKERYEQLRSKRDQFVRRGRLFAEITIPSLFPPEGHSEAQYLPQNYQGLGSRAVIHLSARLMTALLPPGQTFFRFTVPPEVLLKSDTVDVPPEVSTGLVKAELLATNEIERRSWRAPTNLALQLLIVTGNALEQVLEDNTIRIFRLDQYVIAREPNGGLQELLIEEKINTVALSDKLAKLLPPNTKRDDPTAKVCLYTWAKKKEDGKWDVAQYLEDEKVPDAYGSYDVLPFNALRWSIVPGEDYGRGKVEEHYADFMALEGYEKAMLEGAAMAARNIIMVRPNATGGNLRQRIAKARNGDVIVGNPEDLSMFQFQNVTGLQLTRDQSAMIRQELSAAFLLNTGMRRDAERVTAYELRQNAEELDGVLGGVYSMLSADMQRNRITRLIYQMQKKRQLPDWPTGSVEPIITTGLEALGRERDLSRIQTAGAFIQQMGPEAQQYVKTPVLLSKVFNALQLPDAVRSEEEVAKMKQEMMAAQAAANTAETVGSAAGVQAVTPPQQ